MNLRRLLLSLAACLLTVFSFAQTSLWTDVDAASARAYTAGKKDVLPGNFRLVRLNRAQANQLQQQALSIASTQLPTKKTGSFDIPLPDKKTITANLFDAPVLSDELQKAYPGIKTYQLSNLVTKSLTGRLTISDLGVSGIIFTDNGTAYISPAGPDYPDVHMVYYVKDMKGPSLGGCGVTQEFSNLRQSEIEAGDGKKRSFRLAIAATGEYTTWAGSQANAMTYITIVVNDISAIYERDATITFTLVTNNSILFTNATTDPYATVSFPTSTTLSTNQSTLNTNIGSGNFDLGIVFNNDWNGGLAAVGVVCNNTQKGQGAAGLKFGTGANPTAGPQGPIFDATVAHELAHQFSATHSFAANNGGCAGNTTAATAYEPGGGSTLMAYAGTCTGNAYQNNTDLYFHAGNIAQIQSYVTGGSASCSTPVTISNHQPVITVPAAAYTIPASTPFTLTSTGTDADGNTLKYTWEEMDAGLVTSSPPQSTNTSGPNFRSYPPSATGNTRTFPGIADIIAGNSPVYEVLSGVTRTMNFRATARDEAAGGGGTGEANVAVNVNAGAGPFVVTSQSSATNWTADGSSTATITWNVASTTAAPVSCSAVDILFSIDGGYTYPYTLLAGTPNDGTQTIVVPSINTYTGRIKVQASNNIFFNINQANVTIISSCSAEGATFTPSANVSAPSGSTSLDLALNPQYGSVVATSGQVTTADPVSYLTLIDSATGNCTNYTNPFYYDSYSFTVNKPGNYTLSIGTAIFMNLYSGTTYNTTSTCTNRMVSNNTFSTVTNMIRLSPTITASLVPGTYYTLIVGSAPSVGTAVPATYSVTVSAAPSGGNLYSGTPNPGASFNYTYVIVDNATGIIKAIDPGSDLSNSSTYPAGTYTVYGLSYANSISPATLNGYIGGQLSTLSNDLLYNPSATCGNLSKNSLVATVNATLPVSLLPLRAKKENNSVLLTWATASEQNNNYFEVQRSVDGISFGNIIGRVTGAGNSSSLTNYNFTDAGPVANLNYYRIKQVDLDGTSTFSNMAKISFSETNSSITTYPNPAISVVNMEYYASAAGRVKWLMVDGKGAVVRQGVFVAQSGRNLQQLNIIPLARGAYVIKTIAEHEVMTLKFIKK